jgi:hypothetical protein
MHAHNLNAHHHDHHPSTVHHRRNETKKKAQTSGNSFFMRYPMIREGYVLSPTRDYIRKTNLDSHDTTTPKSLPYRFPTCFGRLKWNQLSLDERKEKNKLGVDLLSSKMLETTGRHVETTHTRRLNTPFQVPRDNWPTIFLSEFVYWNVEEFNAESSGLP